MPAAWFSDGEQVFESIKVPCIDVCTLIPTSVISTLAYCNLLFNRLPNFALHRLHIFSPPGSAPLPGASCWGRVLKVFIPGLVLRHWVTLWILHFWTPHLLAGFSSPLVPPSVCGSSQCSPATRHLPWAKLWHESLATTAPRPVKGCNVVGERRQRSKAVNWQPTGRVWPKGMYCFACIVF